MNQENILEFTQDTKMVISGKEILDDVDEISSITEELNVKCHKNGDNRRFSVIETENWQNIFRYSQQNNQHELSEEKIVVDDIEDAQWREILGCKISRDKRVVSAPLPVNSEKISSFMKRKSDPVQLPSTRRTSVIETEKWKNMFACDTNFDYRPNLKLSPTSQGEDESWKQFFGCESDTSNPNNCSTSSSSPRTPPIKSSPNSKSNRSPIHLAPITEKDIESNSSSNGSAELPKPKLMAYLRSMMKAKLSKKKTSSK